MKILGLSAHYHDAAAALLVDGHIVAAAQEERFSRTKHDAGFPLQAAQFCLQRGGLRADQLDAVAWYEKPFQKFDRLLSGFLQEAPRGMGRFIQAVPLWLGARLWVRSEIADLLEAECPVYFLQHHESHAASAYGPSPFEEAAVLTLDGVGEWTTNGLWEARGCEVCPIAELQYPDSLGLLYSACTAWCGFRVNDGEYKLMGLAPYGEPRFVQTLLDEVIDVRSDGSYRLNPEYFAYRYQERMTSPAFDRLFGSAAHPPGQLPTKLQADMARSIQAITEDVVLKQARHARKQTAMRSLCMAGGVALNCVANGRLAREAVFDQLWIQPAAGDAGGALGAAFALHFRLERPTRELRDHDAQQGSLLGPEFSEQEMEEAIHRAGLTYRRLEPEQLTEQVAASIAAGNVVGWFQGRMEFGPRALGNRSILADPRDPDMQSRVNRAVKFREGFRPFAPMVLQDRVSKHFLLPCPSPYMLLTGSVIGAEPLPDPLAELNEARGLRKIRSALPAITHVDASARVQTVAAGSNPRIEALLDRFEQKTGCPVLLNTSFNVKDEPIVCSPWEAIQCFCRARIEELVIGPFVVTATDEDKKRVIALPAPTAAAQRAWGKALLEIVGGAVGFGIATGFLHSPRLGWGLLAIAATMATLRVILPSARGAVDRALAAIGKALSMILAVPALAFVFVAVIVPWGVLWGDRKRTDAEGGSLWRKPAQPTHDPKQPH
ncbi:MAG: hypothetical protein HY898_26775 [Deltaproteobacteria bacterium]|nr:hypothetical protein [Deltaproteobacteria bacterium]